MKLAFLCCCEAMNQTGPGTLSYEFSKGSILNTVIIGYVGMGSCPNWFHSLDWQNFIFERVDKGHTFKKSFDLACAEYPSLSDYVKFVGNPYLKIDIIKSFDSNQNSFGLTI